MKMNLLKNYWLMLVAWIMILSGYDTLACLIGLFASILLLIRKIAINKWRVVAIFFITYSAVKILLTSSNIPYFFSNITVFLAFVSLNVAIYSETLTYTKLRFLEYNLFIEATCMIVMSLIIFILPDSSYTLFSKASLFIMICLIFLPYFVTALVSIFIKKIENIANVDKKVLKNTNKHSKIILNSK